MTVPLGADEASGSEYRPILQPKSTKFEFDLESSKRKSMSV